MLSETRIIRELDTQRKRGVTNPTGLCNAVLREVGHPALSANGITQGYVRDAFAVLAVIDHQKKPVQRKTSAMIMRERVADYVNRCGCVGATDEEISVALKINGNSARPRRIELFDEGRVANSGKTRATASGKQATIWIIASIAA